MAEKTTQLIKQSIAYRAKYRIDGKRLIGVLSVVPHPRSRSGDPVKSLRTMQLNGTVAKEGYDPVEANSNGVAVEQKPIVAGGLGLRFRMISPRSRRLTPTCWSEARA